jgi:hypothetical protein
VPFLEPSCYRCAGCVCMALCLAMEELPGAAVSRNKLGFGPPPHRESTGSGRSLEFAHHAPWSLEQFFPALLISHLTALGKAATILVGPCCGYVKSSNNAGID